MVYWCQYIVDPPAIIGKSRSHLTSLRILRRVANGYVHSEIMALCYPSVAQRYTQTSLISVNYFPICGGSINYHTELRGICVLKFPFLRRNRVDILKEINI
jgi:hypothetical protein